MTSFFALAKKISQEDDQTHYMNPISRINKGFRKAKNYQNPPSPISKRQEPESQMRPQLSFRSLSKDRHKQFSESKFKTFEGKASCNSSFGKLSGRGDKSINYNSSRKRLNFDTSIREESKENKMNFSNIIRRSKEKSLKNESLLKKSQKKSMKPPKQNKDNPFNRLKNRLTGQKPIREPQERSKSPLRTPLKQEKKEEKREAHTDMVLMSIQSSVRQIELDMSPVL